MNERIMMKERQKIEVKRKNDEIDEDKGKSKKHNKR
jgi:hypothetical protein